VSVPLPQSPRRQMERAQQTASRHRGNSLAIPIADFCNKIGTLRTWRDV
jgi:hypothetical protein